MSRLNHHRPHIRLLDNLRRELAKYPNSSPEASPDVDWPPFLRPIAANPVAMRALFDLIESIDKWFSEQTEKIALSNPPSYVLAAYRRFATVRVENSYDTHFSGYDWLNYVKHHPTEAGDFRTALLEILKHIPPR